MNKEQAIELVLNRIEELEMLQATTNARGIKELLVINRVALKALSGEKKEKSKTAPALPVQ